MSTSRVLMSTVLLAGLASYGYAQSDHAEVAEPPAELTDRTWLYENMRHLYRWHIDERDIDPVAESGEVLFWIGELKPKLDDGDKSRFGEVILPQFSTSLKVKQANYAIPELDVTVNNPDFRITSVTRIEAPEHVPAGYTEIRANYTEMRDELFRTRGAAQFPEGELLERLRAAVRSQITRELSHEPELDQTPTQVVFLAPLSPAANETWVFWETGRAIIHFSSDIDITNPVVWEHEELAVHLYDLDNGVVVSLDEVGGSNAYMTRDQAGRALFNCIVLGRRVELKPDVKKVD